MRYKIKKKVEPELGDTRLRHKFLCFPKYMSNEWRWLEITTWVQELVLRQSSDPEGGCACEYHKWVDVRWEQEGNP